MFKNVGKKIQTVATVALVINIVYTIIADFMLCSTLGKSYDIDVAIIILIFLLLMVVGTIVSWIVSLFIYGFGILVSNSEGKKPGCVDKDYNEVKFYGIEDIENHQQ